jgi:4-hydroxy-tetrahydrodipicolinate reductase
MKVALIGYGKMGQEIEKVILDKIKSEGQNDEIVLRITDLNLADLTVENLKKADVAIEFTQPDAAVANIYKCFEAGVPVVVGTTAWLNRLDEVRQKCTELNGTLFFSPNYSIGVNIFWEVNKRLAQLMNKQPQYELSMEEIHHTEKKDAPSGTAVRTAEVILQQVDRKKNWKLEEGGNKLPASDSLLIVAKRLANVPGTHTVTYSSDVDFIEIKHEAISRRGFAEGAVLAARYVLDKKGVYEMKDLLGIG